MQFLVNSQFFVTLKIKNYFWGGFFVFVFVFCVWLLPEVESLIEVVAVVVFGVVLFWIGCDPFQALLLLLLLIRIDLCLFQIDHLWFVSDRSSLVCFRVHGTGRHRRLAGGFRAALPEVCTAFSDSVLISEEEIKITRRESFEFLTR
jgi:hypothetical protein